MIICLYGPTCTGKTTIARMIAEQLLLPLRSCGDEIRARAVSIGVGLDDIPDDIHRAVDQETIEWAMANRPCVVEGRFLDAVFAVRKPDVIIRLQATDEVRIRRGRARWPDFELADLRRYDDNDSCFREQMFEGRIPTDPCQVVDTTNLTVEECVECVRSIVEQRLA
jgi:cytidylate kinase